MDGESLWPRLAGLSLVVEACEYDRLHPVLAYEFERITTHARLVGAGVDGLRTFRCSPVRYRDETRPSLPLEGDCTLAGFCDHVGTLELWPEPPGVGRGAAQAFAHRAGRSWPSSQLIGTYRPSRPRHPTSAPSSGSTIHPTRPDGILIPGQRLGVHPRATRLVLSRVGVAHRRGGHRDPDSQAFIESWFRYLKERCIWRHEFETLDQAR